MVEVKSSSQWYQKQANGLGEDFIHELECAYDAIEELPETWPKFQRGFRRFLSVNFLSRLSIVQKKFHFM